MKQFRFILLLFYCILVIISCKTSVVIKDYELNKLDIVTKYYAPSILNGKVYKYQDIDINGKQSFFYISYNYISKTGESILEITDYDDLFHKIGFKRMAITNDTVKILDYVVYTFINNGSSIENRATISEDSDYSLSISMNNFHINNEITVNKYTQSTEMINCEKSTYNYNNYEYDTFIISYSDFIKADM